MRINEIEVGGDVDTSYIHDLNKDDYTHPQYDLFAHIPTLDPHFRSDQEYKMDVVGHLGPYRIAIVDDHNAADEPTYALFDRSKVIAWIALGSPKTGYKVHDAIGKGMQVYSVYVDDNYQGAGLARKLYEWLLRHVCDYLVADEQQTRGGVALWRKFLNSRLFDVLVYDRRTGVSRRRWAGKDFGQVYKTNDLVPWMTLGGKSIELLRED